MIRYNYNRQVNPPAPFVHVTISRPDGQKTLSDVPAKLDTGADVTVLPWEMVEALELLQLDEVPAVGFGGRVVTVPTFLVELAIRKFQPTAIEVLAIADEPFILLGRDVLNRHRVILDGPLMVLEIE